MTCACGQPAIVQVGHYDETDSDDPTHPVLVFVLEYWACIACAARVGWVRA